MKIQELQKKYSLETVKTFYNDADSDGWGDVGDERLFCTATWNQQTLSFETTTPASSQGYVSNETMDKLERA